MPIIAPLPTRVDGSLGRVKSDAGPVTNLNVEVPSNEWNTVAAYLADLAPTIGLSDGSTVGSVIARIIALESAVLVPPTLDDVLTAAGADNTATIPNSDPVILGSSVGTMLGLNPAADLSELRGTDVTLVAGRGGAFTPGDLRLTTANKTGADFTGTVFIDAGSADAATGGPIYLRAGASTGSSGGPVLIYGGDSGAGSPGNVQILGGTDTVAFTRAGIELSGDEIVTNTTQVVEGTTTYDKGLRLQGSTGVATLSVGDSNPNGQVNGSPGSLMTTTSGQLFQCAGGIAWNTVRGTLDSVINAGTPDNTVTVPAGNPIVLSGSGIGTMLEVNPSSGLAGLLGTNVVVQGYVTTGTGVNVNTSTGVGATGSSGITVRTGSTGTGVTGSLILASGLASGAGTSGNVTVETGTVTGAGIPGQLFFTSGINSTSSVRSDATVTSGTLRVVTDAATAGSLSYNRGISLQGSGASTAAVRVGNSNPNGQLSGSVGDLMLDVSGTGNLRQCVGTTNWKSFSNVLWEWNQTNTSQFLTAIDLGIGAGTAGLTIGTTSGGPNGTLLRLSSTEIVAGGVLFPINFVFPRRYVIEITWYGFDFTDVTNALTNLAGVTVAANTTGTATFSLAHGNITNAAQAQYVLDYAITSGTPFGPAVSFNSIASAQWVPTFGGSQSGLCMRYTVNTQRPFVAATPELTITIEGSGSDQGTPATQPRVNASSRDVGAYPAGWDTVTLNTIGLLVGNGAATTSWTADIESFRILTHPSDLK